MPRKRQGGQRVGKPGQAYGNRSDLNSQRSLPMRTAPGQTYGARKAQLDAQRLVPMGAPPSGLPQGMASGPSPAPQGPQGPPGQQGGPALGPGQWPAPGDAGDLMRPTERPNEPVTAGAKLGAGPGPESLPAPQVLQGGAMSRLLAQAAQTTGSASLRTLANQAAANGQ